MGKIKLVSVVTLMVIGFITLAMIIGYFGGLLIAGGLSAIAINGSIVCLIPVIIGMSIVVAAPPIGYYFGKHVIKEVVEVLEKD